MISGILGFIGFTLMIPVFLILLFVLFIGLLPFVLLGLLGFLIITPALFLLNLRKQNITKGEQ